MPRKGTRQATAPFALALQDERQRQRVKGGKASEAFVEALHERCLEACVAYVHKVPTPYVIVGRDGGVFRGRYSRKAGADYRGVMLDGSLREVRMECKSDADPNGRVYLRELREQQRADLDAAQARGDVAVLLVVLGRGPFARVFALPWSEAREHAGLGQRELAAWRVRASEPYLARWVQTGEFPDVRATPHPPALSGAPEAPGQSARGL